MSCSQYKGKGIMQIGIAAVLFALFSLAVAAAPPDVTVTFPNSGENITTRFLNVTWIASDPDGDAVTLNIFIDINNRTEDGSIQLATSHPNDGSFMIDLLPLGLQQDYYFVRVDAVADIDKTTDYSDKPFFKHGFALSTLSGEYAGSVRKTEAPEVSIAPNFLLQGRGIYPIRFNVTDSNGDELFGTLTYSIGNATFVIDENIPLADFCEDADNSTITGNSCAYLWNTTAVNSTLAINISITNTHFGDSVVSPAVGVDNLPQLAVLFPNGGENLTTESIEILWSSGDRDSFPATVDVYYDADTSALNGRNLISSNEADDGSLLWSVRGLPQSKFFVSIDAFFNGMDSNNNNMSILVTDYSDGSFEKLGFNETFLSSFVSNNFAVTLDTAPQVVIVQPDGSETINSTFPIVFKVTDREGDALAAAIYYSAAQGAAESLIVKDLSLDFSNCADSDFSTATENTCTYLWDTADLNAELFIDVFVSDSIKEGFDSSNNSFTVNNYPAISNATAVNVTSTSAIIRWLTEFEAANSTVQYGIFPVFDNEASSPAFVNSHALQLSGLAGNKLYNARAVSCDNTGLCTASAQINFTTLDSLPALAVTFPNGGEVINSPLVNITWEASDIDNDAIAIDLFYDLDNQTGNGRTQIAMNLSNSGSYVWDIQQLARANYFVSVDARTVSLIDGEVTVTDYSDSSFEKSDIELFFASNQYAVNASQNTPPAATVSVRGNSSLSGNISIDFAVSDLEDDAIFAQIYYSAARGSQENQIGSLPLSQDICSTAKTYAAGGAELNCTVVWETSELNGGFYIDINLSDSIHAAINSSEQFSVNNLPLILNISVQDISPNAVNVSIATSEDANATISYGLNASYGSQAGSPDFLAERIITIGNLTGNRLYDYKAEVCDSTGLCTGSAALNFTTLNTLHTVQVLAPNGGEIIDSMNLLIEWSIADADNDDMLVDIYYDVDTSISNGRFLISASETNDGSFVWDLTAVIPGPYFISIDGRSQDLRLGEAAVTDYSDGTFTKAGFNNSFTSNNYDAAVLRNTKPSVNITFPQPFDVLVGSADIRFVVQDSEEDILFADLSYSGEIFRRELETTNPTSTDLAAYPVRAVINTASLISQGKLRPDGIELKVVVNETQVPIFIEKGFGTNETIIWFEADLKAGETRKDIFLVYGEASALAFDRAEPRWQNFAEAQNVLANKPLLSFSTETVGFPAANANDNDKGTKWRGTGTQEFIRYNLTSLYSPYRINVTAAPGVDHYRARRSSDNNNFTVINDTFFNGGTAAGISFRPMEMAYFLLDQINSTAANDIFEIELFTPLIIESAVRAEQTSGRVVIAQGVDLSNALVCADPDSTTSTPNNCSFAWALSQLDGSFCLQAEVSDLISDIAVSQVCNITIDNVNDFPALIRQIPDQVWEINTNLTGAFDLDDFFRDPNNDSLSYSVNGNTLISVVIDNATHLVSFSQPINFTGKESVTFTADDGQRGVTQSNPVELFVTPTRPNISGLPDQFLAEDSAEGFAINLHDFSSDKEVNVSELSFAVANNTNPLLISCSIVSGNFLRCGAPAPDKSGTANITVSASDGTSSDFDTFTIFVAEINDAPAIANLPDLQIDEDENPADNWIDLWNFTSDAEDEDAALNFSIVNATNPSLISCSIAENRYVNCSDPAPEQSGFTDIAVTVADTGNSTGSDAFRITVLEVDDMPAITLLSPEDNFAADKLPINLSYAVNDVDDTAFTCNLTVDSSAEASGINVANGTTIAEAVSGLTAGLHAWQVVCQDATNTAFSEARAFSLATELRIAADGLIISNTTPIQGESINITARVDNIGEIAAENVSVNFYIDAALIGSGRISIPQNDSSAAGVGLDTASLTGMHSITAIADEEAGIPELDTASNSANRTITVIPDTFPPTFEGLAQIPSNIEEETPNVTIEIDVLDRGIGVDAANVRLVYSIGSNVTVNLMSSGDNQRFSAVVAEDFNNLQGFNFTYYISAFDLLGNTARTDDVVDFIGSVNDAPELTIQKPDNQSSFDAQGSIEWAVLDEDSDAVTSTVFYRTRGSASPASPAGALVQLTETAAAEFLWNTSLLAEGFYQIFISATDGNLTANASSAIFTIDHTPPENVVLLSPIGGTHINAQPVQFEFIASDNLSALLSCDMHLDGALNASNASANSGVAKTHAVNLGEGPHDWSVACRDLAGLASSSINETFVVDRQAPVIGLIAPADGAAFSKREVAFEYTAADNLDAVLSCSVIVNGAAAGSQLIASNSSSAFSLSLSSAAANSWKIRCLDDAGNSGESATRKFNTTTDLSIESIMFDPPLPLQGTGATIRINVSNLGAFEAQNALVEARDKDNNPIAQTLRTLQANASQEVPLVWNLAGLSFGAHNATIKVVFAQDDNLSNNAKLATLSIEEDTIPVEFSEIKLEPANVTENSSDVIFSVDVTDFGVGVNRSLVTLLYGTGNISAGAGRNMPHISGNTHRATLTKSDVDWDEQQGRTLQFFANAQDMAGNAANSSAQFEFIDLLDDAPIVNILKPAENDVFTATETINFTVDNDGEGLTSSSLRYWKPFPFAPGFSDDPVNYFLQGQWLLIDAVQVDSTLLQPVQTGLVLWATNGFNGETKIRIETTDGAHNVVSISKVFVVDNAPPNITIDNFEFNSRVIGPGGRVFGRADGTFSNISSIAINDSGFELAISPAGLQNGSYEFRSAVRITENASLAVTATDFAGIDATSHEVFVLDANPPVIHSVLIENSFTNDVISISANVTDDIAVSHVIAAVPDSGVSRNITLTGDSGLYKGTFRGPSAAAAYNATVFAIDHGDNIASRLEPFMLEKGPDLAVAAGEISFNSTSPITGDKVKVSAIIRNLGVKEARNVPITARVGNQTAGSDIINVTASSTAQIVWDTKGFAGDKIVSISIENASGVFESDYSNNEADRAIFIDGPDLIVSSVLIEPDAAVLSGEPRQVIATIQNLRDIPANNVRISFYVNRIDLGSRFDFKFVNVAANSAVNASATWQTAGFAGNSSVLVFANPDNLPAETNTANNIGSSSAFIKEFVPEQIPDTLIFPQRSLPPIPGERIRGLASGDFNNDTRPDFVAGTDKGTVMLYNNTGVINVQDERLKSVNYTQILIANLSQTAWGMAAADFNFDGFPDIIVGTERGEVVLLNNTNGTFSANITLFDAGEHAYGLAVTDVNNDNLFDIIVGHKVGHVDIYIHNGSEGPVGNETYVFLQTVTTRDQPYGITTGDFDLDGRIDIFVGDRLGQLEKIIFEEALGRYNGFLFADIGAFAHGITAADMDFNDRLDFAAIGFDGNVNLYYSRATGLTVDPLIIGNVPNALELTSADVDQDLDIDIIAAGDDGNITLLLNSLDIRKRAFPQNVDIFGSKPGFEGSKPGPTKRISKVDSKIENPYARDMREAHITEFWKGSVAFVEDDYIITKRTDFGPEVDFVADIFFFDTVADNENASYHFYLNFPNQVCVQEFPRFGGSPNGCSSKFSTGAFGVLLNESFMIKDVLDIFNNEVEMKLRESFTYQYKLFVDNESNRQIAGISEVNYTLEGGFSTPRTNFLLSDDVTNLNDITASMKNINITNRKIDRDFIEEEIRVPDFAVQEISFVFDEPLVPGENLRIDSRIRNLNSIAVEGVKAMILIDGAPVMFGSLSPVNYTAFNINELAAITLTVNTKAPSSVGGILNVTVIVNPFLEDIETDLANNRLSSTVITVPSSDLLLEEIFFDDPTLVEGERAMLFVRVRNVGNARSYFADVSVFGFREVPYTFTLDCSPESQFYNANLCDGEDFGGDQRRRIGNLEPNESVLVNFTTLLGDFNLRSQGGFNISALVTNVGSGDSNLSNNARIASVAANETSFIVVPSKVELNHHDRGRLDTGNIGISISNPSGQEIEYRYLKWNGGGTNADNFDVILYLDNNDSQVLSRFSESIRNHSAITNVIVIDWSNISEGDHIVYSYIDYGKNDAESTAVARRTDNLTFTASVIGLEGNNIAVTTENRTAVATTVATATFAGNAVVPVSSTAALDVGDNVFIAPSAEQPSVLNAAPFIIINKTSSSLTLSPALTRQVSNGWLVHRVLDSHKVAVAASREVVQQSEFGVSASTLSRTEAFFYLSDGSDIRTLADVVDVLLNGGQNESAVFVNESLGLFAIDASTANLLAAPAAQQRTLVLTGTYDERSEFNNVNKVTFRWKEIVASSITFLPKFPVRNDIVTVSASISNAGDIRSGAFNVSFFAEGELIEKKTISLTAGGSQNVNFLYRIPADLEKKTVSVRISADSDDEVHHEDENNNNLSATIPISKPMEFNVLGEEYDINFLTAFESNNSSYNSGWLPSLEEISMEYDAAPAFVDYDNDGDLDLIVGSLDGKLRSFENTGLPSIPAFREIAEWEDVDMASTPAGTVRMSGIDAGARSTPAFADMNSDNLTDMIVGSTHGFVKAYKREIRQEQVLNELNELEIVDRFAWVETNIIGLTGRQFQERVSIAIGDLDGDSDLDIVAGAADSSLTLLENAGNSTNPQFADAAAGQWGFNSSIFDSAPNAHVQLFDLDSDSDLDLVLSNDDGVMFYENIGNASQPQWQKQNAAISLANKTGYRAALADLDNDADADLVLGTNDVSRIDLRRGYFEPINVQVINYAENQIFLDRIEVSLFNDSNGARITDLFTWGPMARDLKQFRRDACVVVERVQFAELMDPNAVLEVEFNVNLPADIPVNTYIGLTATKRDRLGGEYLVGKTGICAPYSLAGGTRASLPYVSNASLGGSTYELFAEEDSIYEIHGSYKLYSNSTLSEPVSCLQQMCPLFGLAPGQLNTIVLAGGSGDIFRYQKIFRPDFNVVRPDKPPLEVLLANKFEIEWKPGYIEDAELEIRNNNRRSFKIDRVAFTLFDKGIAAGNVSLDLSLLPNATANDSALNLSEITIPYGETIEAFTDSRAIDLFTDTSGFTVGAGSTLTKRYKIFVPEGVALNSSLYVSAIEKRSWDDEGSTTQWKRSNIADLWKTPSDEGFGVFSGKTFSADLNPDSLTSSPNASVFADDFFWGHQDFNYDICRGDDCVRKGPPERTSFLRKHIWIPNSIVKAEQIQTGSQTCSAFLVEEPSGITTWINGKLKSSWTTLCNTVTIGHTPNFELLERGRDNEFDIFQFGPHRDYDVILYEVVGYDTRDDAIVEPVRKAFDLQEVEIGADGLMRRQYEETVHLTIKNNDDDPISVDAVTLDLISPAGKEIHLLTDTTPRLLSPESVSMTSYKVIIPGDVPLNSMMRAQIERVFEFPDKLWARDHEAATEDFLAEDTNDIVWGDTLPTGTGSFYRKRIFAPSDITRAEVILGGGDSTILYLNGEFQGRGYAGWSPLSITSGIRPGELNQISASGPIPDTNSRIYTGTQRSGGRVIEPEEEAFFMVFGIREQEAIPGREPFFVQPGEEITARVGVENKFASRTLSFDLRLFAVDFADGSETTLRNFNMIIPPLQSQELEIDLTIPATVSEETKLQLSGVWNELLPDKNWLRGSNFNDATAMNSFLDDSQWGVVALSPENEKAKYFRKNVWVDTTVQGLRFSVSGGSDMFINGLDVAAFRNGVFDLTGNEFTKTENNVIALRSDSFNPDADITLRHFVPVRSTDLELVTPAFSGMSLYRQGSLNCFEDETICDCANATKGECAYYVNQSDPVEINFTIRNTGELFAKEFVLSIYSEELKTGETSGIADETITMHPFSEDRYTVRFDTSQLAGMNAFRVVADTEDRIIETSEFNNEISRNIFISTAPEIAYLAAPELTGLGEFVTDIESRISNQDGDRMNITLDVVNPDGAGIRMEEAEANSTAIASTSEARNFTGGRYTAKATARDELGRIDAAELPFDLFNSLYLNVKTDQDVYHYGQMVRLTGAAALNLSKLQPNTAPELQSVRDDADTIRGGSQIAIAANALDRDRDVITLYVCGSEGATPRGCIGITHCSASGLLNPGCSFASPEDSEQHKWFAYVFDTHGEPAAANGISGTYTTDVVAPRLELVSFAGNDNLVDNQADGRLLVVVKGEQGMKVRIAKDNNFRFHKDRSYSLMEKECAVAGEFAVCDAGDIPEFGPARDQLTNRTRLYISASDSTGNEQKNIENLDIEFLVSYALDSGIYDDYDGSVLPKGSSVTISGDTKYCIDAAGTCSPSIPSVNATLPFTETKHLRYFAGTEIKDRLVIINTPPEIISAAAFDLLGQHSFEVLIELHDENSQRLSCAYDAGFGPLPIKADGSRARFTLAGLTPLESVTVNINCSDGFEASEATITHTVPNSAPVLRNMADVSLQPLQTSSINMSLFARDLEKDQLTFTASVEDAGVANAVLNNDVLTIAAGSGIGSTRVFAEASDGFDSSLSFFDVFVENPSESKLKNDEYASTTILLQQKILHLKEGVPSDVFVKNDTIRVLPGAANQIMLTDIFEWNSFTSPILSGNFSVEFSAADEQGNALRNRNRELILDSYNFTLLNVNTPPNISGLPDASMFDNSNITLDLALFTDDAEQDLAGLLYGIASQSNNLLNCSIAGQFIACSSGSLTGSSIINVSVFDSEFFDYDDFSITVIARQSIDAAEQNLTYTFISEHFNVTGDAGSGFRNVSLPDNIAPGVYNVSVIVSDGILSVTDTIAVTVFSGNAPPVLGGIGDRFAFENETLVIQLNATDPDGAPLTFGTNAAEVLPGTFAFNETTGLFEWTPAFEDAGAYSITFSVTDGTFAAEETISIAVNNVNRPPEFGVSIALIEANESAIAVIHANVTDPDGDSINLSINDSRFAANGTDFTWQTTDNDSGNITVLITATDGESSQTQEVTIAIRNVNRPPFMKPIESQTAIETEIIAMSLTGISPAIAVSDADNENNASDDDNNLTVTINDTRFIANGSAFNWQTTADDSGAHFFTATVSDGEFNESQEFNVTVLNLNRAPELEFMQDIVQDENTTVSIIANATDPDNENAVSNDDNELVFSANDSRFVQTGSTFTWHTGFEDAGQHSVLISVYDGLLNDSQTVTITIVNVNTPPALQNISSQTISENETLAIQLNATDAEGDVLTFVTDAGEVLPSPFAFNESAGLFRWTPNIGDGGTYHVAFSVSDGEFSDSVIVAIVVVAEAPVPVNNPPVLAPVQNVTVGQNRTAVIQLSASDADNDSLTFGTDAGDVLPSPFAFNSSTGLFVWTPSAGDAGAYNLLFNVTDGTLSDAVPVTITVKPADSEESMSLSGGERICKIILDTQGNIVDGEEVAGSRHTILTTWGDAAFTAPLSLNADLIGNDGVLDAQCAMFPNIALGNHYWREEITLSAYNWTSALYNDQHEQPVYALSDFYEFASAEGSTNSDGHVWLYAERPNRTLVVLNQYALSGICGNALVDQSAEQCDDGNLADGDGCSAICLNEAPVETTEVQIAYSSDDAYHDPLGWPNYADSTNNIRAGRPSSTPVWGGWRWANLNIPPGSVITGAYVEFNQLEWGYSNIPTTLAFENSSNALTFSSGNSPAHRWSKRTAFQTQWNWSRQTPGSWIRTPSLAAGIQELAANGINDLVLLEDGTPSLASQSHEWASYDYNPSLAARLHIEYRLRALNDTAPPIRVNARPSGQLPAGTTDVNLTLQTHEASVCRYSTVANASFNSMPGAFLLSNDTSHSHPISGLSAGAHAYYVRCQDESGNANTDDFTISFDILEPDITAPVISNIQVAASTTTAEIRWTTDESATSAAQYGLTPSLGTEIEDTNLLAEHSLVLVGLLQNTTYYFKVLSRDASGNEASSSAQTFTTAIPLRAELAAYTDAFVNDFTYNEWPNPPGTSCLVKESNTTEKASGSGSLEANLREWCTLFVYRPTSFNISNFTRLELDVYGAAPPQRSVGIMLATQGWATTGRAVLISDYILIEDRWQHLTIALSDFNASNNLIKGLQFRDSAGPVSTGNVLFDNIRFT
ncbi:VCBS repeat-containing protein [Candidatus Woesearchaeota archaeon]|nr:VCBS repeat-containing protein [Candidatus Woesearchaeota archaeon]